jgi:hypothetical protein
MEEAVDGGVQGQEQDAEASAHDGILDHVFHRSLRDGADACHRTVPGTSDFPEDRSCNVGLTGSLRAETPVA